MRPKRILKEPLVLNKKHVVDKITAKHNFSVKIPCNNPHRYGRSALYKCAGCNITQDDYERYHLAEGHDLPCKTTKEHLHGQGVYVKSLGIIDGTLIQPFDLDDAEIIVPNKLIDQEIQLSTGDKIQFEIKKLKDKYKLKIKQGKIIIKQKGPYLF